jgi:hypothetical protein
MKDTYRVLPHRSIRVVGDEYEHHCGMTLTERDVKEANWCPHCAVVINKAAERRGRAHIAEVMRGEE